MELVILSPPLHNGKKNPHTNQKQMLDLILFCWVPCLVEWIHHSPGHQMRQREDIMNSSLVLTPDSQFRIKS